MTAFENTPGRMRPFRAGDCPTRVPRVGLENDEKGRGHAARPLAAAEHAVSAAVLQDEKRTSVRLLPSMDRRGFLKRAATTAGDVARTILFARDHDLAFASDVSDMGTRAWRAGGGWG